MVENLRHQLYLHLFTTVWLVFDISLLKFNVNKPFYKHSIKSHSMEV